ncbi:hypothetical protein [Congzhengia sp.]|jgi:hypothetical protein|uniref:hypothetical protein n=1 Tax=Congzhengia sp. TaxID=2944168 RepID=UPI0030782244
MTYYTIVRKTHTCPKWNTDVRLEAKYYYFDEENPYSAKYVSCKCPIAENCKSTGKKKNYAYHPYCGIEQECLATANFKPIIDILTDGYSQ